MACAVGSRFSGIEDYGDMTIKELKAFIADLPDDMPIEHYSERMDSLVYGHFVVCPDEYGFLGNELDRFSLVVCHEN
jgi:hypothetical protein